MTKTSNEQPRVPTKPGHLAAERSARIMSPHNAFRAEKRHPDEAANNSPAKSNAPGSHANSNDSHITASTQPTLRGFFDAPMAMFRDIFPNPLHGTSPKFMAHYFAYALLLNLPWYPVGKKAGTRK
jgi:hypothetical protein